MRFRRVWEFWPLAVLCLLTSSRWMFVGAWPETESTVSSQAVAAVLAAVVCLALSRFVGKSSTLSKTPWPWGAAAAGAMLFGGMNSGVLSGSASPRGNDLLIALSLVPAVVAVALVARGQGEAGLTGLDVAPGILAPAGLLLLYSQPAFRNVGEDLTMLLTPLCAGVGAAWLAPSEVEAFGTRRAAVVCAGTAVAFGVVGLLTHAKLVLPAVAFDLAVILTAMLSLARLGARRFSAQFVLVPLLLLFEGLAIVQVRPSWEQVGGLVDVGGRTLFAAALPQARGRGEYRLVLLSARACIRRLHCGCGSLHVHRRGRGRPRATTSL